MGVSLDVDTQSSLDSHNLQYKVTTTGSMMGMSVKRGHPELQRLFPIWFSVLVSSSFLCPVLVFVPHAWSCPIPISFDLYRQYIPEVSTALLLAPSLAPLAELAAAARAAASLLSPPLRGREKARLCPLLLLLPPPLSRPKFRLARR